MGRQKTNKPSQLYHYTSLEVLCKLLTEIKNKEMLFHASSVYFMNDSAEYMAARKHCCDEVEEIVMDKDLGIPFALCFSDSEENIPMWSMYAKNGKGVCLEFDYDDLKSYFDNFDILSYKEKHAFNFTRFSNCKYQKIDYEKEYVKPFSINKNHINNAKLIKEMTKDAFIKPISFENEKEWRFMVWKEWHPINNQKMLFKIKNEELCPYIKIPIPVKFLKRIVLCPSADNQMIESVRLLLANYAASHAVSVDKSKITLKL